MSQQRQASRLPGDIPPVFLLERLESIDLFEITIQDLQRHLSNGSFTSKQYVEFCLSRIQQVCDSKAIDKA